MPIDASIAAIERKLAIRRAAETLFQGLSLGSVLLLAALGLAVTFGVMGVINMAHGEFVMLGAYTTFVVQQLCRDIPALLPWSLPLSVPAAFLVAAAAGASLERGLIRHLYGRPLETLLMTFGVGMILQQTVRTIFGAQNREVISPAWMQGTMMLPGGIEVTQNRLWIIVFGIAVLLLVVAAIRFTRFGLEMRAVVQNRRIAATMGIRTGRVDALTFAFGSGIAGMAGVALSQIDNVSPNLGTGYIIDSFMVVVFGGVGSLAGTLVGALRPWAWSTRCWSPMPARCWPRCSCWSPSCCSSSAGRAGCSRSRAGRRNHERFPRRPHSRGHRPRHPAVGADRRGAGAGAAAGPEPAAGGQRALRLGLHRQHHRQMDLLRHPGAGDRPGLGLRRHPVARPRRLLRAGRLRHGHAPDAADRAARRLWPPGAAGLHGVPRLPGTALVLAAASTISPSPC